MSSTDFVSYDDEDLNLDLLLGIPMMMNTVIVNLFRTLIGQLCMSAQNAKS